MTIVAKKPKPMELFPPTAAGCDEEYKRLGVEADERLNRMYQLFPLLDAGDESYRAEWDATCLRLKWLYPRRSRVLKHGYTLT